MFDAERFDSKDRNGDFHVNMRTKDGDECTIVLESAFHDIVRLVAGDDDPYAFRNGLFKPAGRQTNYEIDLWRNEHDVHGRLDKDRSGKARRAMEAVKALGGQVLGDYDPAFGDAVLSVQANGTVIVSGALADGTIVSESGFLSIDDDDYWVVCDLVHYDAQTGNVYDMNFHWLPEFDRSGQVIGWTPGRWTGSFIYIYPFR